MSKIKLQTVNLPSSFLVDRKLMYNSSTTLSSTGCNGRDVGVKEG